MIARYPFDTASFKRIIADGYTYVDKTGYIDSLVKEGQFFFLARPRRFGKSLFISTLEQYFLGNRSLFDGLILDALQPDEWPSFPVLRLDFTGVHYGEDFSLEKFLDATVGQWCSFYQLPFDESISYSEKFYQLLVNLDKKFSSKVVVLIDEYDGPLTKTIEEPALQDLYRSQLQAFYSVLKKGEDHIKFCFMTGVSRYGKVSVFSGLNNLKDISFSDRYAGICGITEEELHRYYSAGVSRLAEKEGLSVEDTFRMLRDNYDGYHFSKELLDVYNPFSINNCLTDLEIKDYWCQSGTPELLSRSLLNIDYDMESMIGTEVSESSLSNLSVYATNPIPLFFQTGYLTLKSYDREEKLYTLGYPNKEVENGILQNILEVYIPSSKDITAITSQLRKSLRKGEPEKFVELLNSFLASIPSKLKQRVAKYENYYHTVFYCLCNLLGLDVDVEHNTSEGYIDMVIKTSANIYLIELKVNGSAETAIKQIEERHYSLKFQTDSRKLFKIGIGFSKKTGTIDSYLIL